MRISDWSSDVCSSDLNQVAKLVLALEPAAFAEKQHGLGLVRREQVHNRGRIGAAHAEVDHGDAVVGGAGHWPVSALHGGAGERAEHVEVAAKVGQQHMRAKFFHRYTGVARQPVDRKSTRLNSSN